MNFPKPSFARSTMRSGTSASPLSAKTAPNNPASKTANVRQSRFTNIYFVSWPRCNCDENCFLNSFCRNVIDGGNGGPVAGRDGEQSHAGRNAERGRAV